MSAKPECYVASPCGFAESFKPWYQDTLLPMLNKYVNVSDPWTKDVSHILQAPPEKQPELWMDYGDGHYDTILKCKLLVAVLDGEPPDEGTTDEVVWAAAHNIPAIGYRSDVRSAGEQNLPYNLMTAAAIRRSGGATVSTFEALESTVKQYTNAA